MIAIEQRRGPQARGQNKLQSVEASRDWPADMTPKQIKLRDKLLKYIACNQRDLEQLYGEVTGQPSWLVEVTTKDGTRLGTGARFGTRGEAEFYNAHFATSQLASDYEAGEVIPSQEKANVQIDGETILFRHDDCVLLQWQPVASSQLLEAESAKTAPLGGAA
jgi:hypothetical protein